MYKIVVTEFMDEQAVNFLKQSNRVIYHPTLFENPARLYSALNNCQAAIIRNKTEIDKNLLTQASDLKVIGRLGVGLDNIDLDACFNRDIEVIPATGINADAVAEYVIGGLFLLFRRSFFRSKSVAKGEWPRATSVGGEIAGKTLGLVGFGKTAQAVSWRARALGVRVIAYDSGLTPDNDIWTKCDARCQSLRELLTQSNAVSLHVPLMAETHHLIDTRELAHMQRGAVLINAARGGVLNEAALITALKQEFIGAALLDVFEQEPLAAGCGYEDVPNLYLTPHIAGLTREANTRVSHFIAHQVIQRLKQL